MRQTLEKLLLGGFDGAFDLLIPASGRSRQARLYASAPIGLCKAKSSGGLFPQKAKAGLEFGQVATRLFDLRAHLLLQILDGRYRAVFDARGDYGIVRSGRPNFGGLFLELLQAVVNAVFKPLLKSSVADFFEFIQAGGELLSEALYALRQAAIGFGEKRPADLLGLKCILGGGTRSCMHGAFGNGPKLQFEGCNQRARLRETASAALLRREANRSCLASSTSWAI